MCKKKNDVSYLTVIRLKFLDSVAKKQLENCLEMKSTDEEEYWKVRNLCRSCHGRDIDTLVLPCGKIAFFPLDLIK